MITAISRGKLVNVPRRMRLSVISRNQRSIRTSQLLLVGKKVHVEPRMTHQPALDPCVLVRGIVVRNHVHIQLCRRLLIDPL